MKSIILSITTFSFCLFMVFSLQAQETSFGFKAGLNFSTISGPLEQGEAGMELERYQVATGFHVGGAINFAFVDRFGLRTELLFSQKGGEYFYEGPSYKVFLDADGADVVTTGTRKMVVNVTNSYVDIPILGYARFGKIEFSAGFDVGILVGSIGQGETNYTALSNSGEELANVITTLDYNYYKNDAREAVGTEISMVQIGLNDVVVPFAEGAYYEFNNKDGSFYNTLDIGVLAGVSFFLNKSLYLGGRINYGLVDITNNSYDVSRQNLQTDGGFISLEDVDKNMSIQASLGFSF